MSASAQPAGAPRGWIGRDLARARRAAPRLQGRLLAWLVFAGLLCALGLAGLRIDILRARYALAEAIREEKALQEEQHRWTAAVETLRDPARLAELAERRGFQRPERILELREPARSGSRP